jgi:hypothetical protein
MFATETAPVVGARGDARRDRLAAAKGNLPTVVVALMLALVALSMIGYAFVMPRVKNGPQIRCCGSSDWR